MHRLAACRDDAGLETHHFGFAGFVLRFATGFFHRHMVGIDKHTIATQHRDLAHFGHGSQAAGQFANHFFFVTTQGVDVEFGLAKVDTHSRQVAHLVHDGCHMQQGFRGNATHVEAHATQLGVTLHDRHFQA